MAANIGKAPLAFFCLTAFAIQALATLLVTFLPEFYANAIGLPVGAVGAAFMTIRIIDLVIDIILGGMMDATRTRWGRFRPWLAASAPVLVVAILMLFGARRGATELYLWSWLLVAFVGYSMIVLSHLAWTATLAAVAAERTRVFAWWQIFATAGQFSILALLPAVASLYPNDPAISVRTAGYVMAVVIPAAILLAVTTVPERKLPSRAHERLRLRDYLPVFRQEAVLRLVLADLFITMSTAIANAVALFYFMGQLGFTRAEASTLILISYAFAFAGTPLFARIAGAVGKSRALLIGALLQATLQVMMALQPQDTFMVTAATMAALGLCIPIAWFLPRAMMADVADATRARTGVDRTAILYASLNGSMKIALGLAVGLSFLLLEALGFNPANAAAPENALPLRMLAGGVPALLSLAVALCMWRYPEGVRS